MNKLYRLNGKLWCKLPIPLPLLLALLFFFLFSIPGHSQTVNGYAHVKAITTVGGKSQLTLDNPQQTGHTFVAGDEVIVIQMQDNVIGGTSNDNNFGTLGNISSAGLYEIATIDAISGSPINQMTLHTVLGNTYNFNNNSTVQVVSFTKLSTGDFPTTNDITGLPWSASLGRGGIIAFQVPGKLTLKNNINADGLGFAGGSASNNSASSCTASTYISSSTSNGAKGEGIYKINTTANPTYVRGRAQVLTGGGGGSTNNGGGAGGGNFTAGGDGATSFVCALFGTTTGGLGGISLNTQLTTGQRLYLGGGGGGGQGASSQQTDGGAGGGIIIIKAGTITTSCGSSVSISANGTNADDVTGFTKLVGAGGGGAAGSILLQVGTYSVPSSCKLNVYANGGDGGNTGTAVDYGSGGGGGQGAVLYVGNAPTSNINSATTPGKGGKMVSGGTAPPGAGNNNDGVVGGIGVVLPVQLVYFGAENKNNTAVLNWTGTDESDVTYNIERSSDGTTFNNIGMVKGSGKTNYTFTDQHPENGINYYRLVMTGSLTAKTTYSSVVNINLTAATRTAVAYPNPAQDHFYIKVQGDNNSMYAVTITDITGKPVYTSTIKPANNIITVTPGISLKPGLYMFKIASKGNEQSGKLMIK